MNTTLHELEQNQLHRIPCNKQGDIYGSLITCVDYSLTSLLINGVKYFQQSQPIRTHSVTDVLTLRTVIVFYINYSWTADVFMKKKTTYLLTQVHLKNETGAAKTFNSLQNYIHSRIMYSTAVHLAKYKIINKGN